MKKSIIFCLSVAIVLFCNSCAVVQELAQAYLAPSQACDNTGSGTTSDAYEARRAVGIITATTQLGLGALQEVSGRDMSAAWNIMDSTWSDTKNLSDKGVSDRALAVGALFSLAARSVDHVVVTKRKEDFQDRVKAFHEANKDYRDPNSSMYDEYFDCRYSIDYNARTITKKEMKDALQCIEGMAADKRKQYEEKLNDILVSDYQMTYEEYAAMPISERPSMLELRRKLQDNSQQSAPTVQEFVDIVDNSHVNGTDDVELVTPTDNSMITRQQELETIKAIKANDFKFNSVELTEVQKIELDKIANTLQTYNDVTICIVGHTCDIGYENVNLKYGLRRAEAGKEYLIGKGIAAERISVESKGELEPLVENNSPENRAQNRRIEFIVVE